MGVVVVALVLAISLIPRVSNGQKLLDALRPANTQQRVAGDRVGINMVSTIVNTEDPIMTAAGGASAEPGVLPVIPRLAQTVSAAPLVTNGWDHVPGTAGVTRFDGSSVTTVPEVRTYFSSDVIPVLETQRANYQYLVSTSKIDFLGPLVLIIGIIVIIYGLLMVFVAWREPEARAGFSPPASSTVTPCVH